MRFARMMGAATLALGLHAGLATAVQAATEVPFTQQAFDATRHEGKPILVHITAPWCPYCAKQRPILDGLENTPAFKSLVVFNVDFDIQKDIVRALGAQKQSTLIVFHGDAEKGRSTGDTDAGSIKTLLDKAND